ncbi:MAG: AbrB/MazE/SpoVT family DNA-binding domain-containing protein [Candidatus Electrothrix aestuarii]|uniref:AbrB/MazE/SpoVT family DNA-binding domain-containing protein n=1 Tax=Candidatus Electrothrix aestuarii TaxID=3062594 RepID=A0AAU8LVG4_9BACT|nr:AbrB/MazE/SpoVT family DNA-binding domain-containing protein [Candidatus Electrothrix aestuarii]
MEKNLRKKTVKIVPIGNSQGIRLPKEVLRKYGFVDSLILEETETGLFLRKQENNKLSWEETYKAMSEEQEDWSDFNVTVADGLEEES